MDRTITKVEDYYIVFTDSTHDHWLLKRLRRSFQHVFAVKKSPGEKFWIIVNPLVAYTVVETVPVAHYPDIWALVDPNAVIVPVLAEIKEKERHTVCVFNCVEVVKSLLGIRDFWLWTPYQLYKHLKKGGG